eukprot:scaffold4516_cov417-Prasinococcus_capsulatus_cf.AAC.7
MENVRSRSFEGPYEGSSYETRQRLFVAAVAVSLGYGLLWPSSDLQSTARLLVAALVFIVGRDAVRSSRGNGKRHVICPVVDLMNYRSGTKSELSYEYFTDYFAVEAASNFSAKSQFFLNYGPQDNDSFLQYYGFVEADNPNDTFILHLSASDVLGDDVFDADVRKHLRDRGYLNLFGSVKFTRSGQIDNVAVLQLLRCAFDACEGHERDFEQYKSEVNRSNERQVIAYIISKLELARTEMPTTLDEDKLKLEQVSTAGEAATETLLALQYRIEKKSVVEDLLRSLEATM